jgi:hypothetical protein
VRLLDAERIDRVVAVDVLRRSEHAQRTRAKKQPYAPT